ncbi:MAG: uridine phosphorylase [Nitrospiraceae bacterium]
MMYHLDLDEKKTKGARFALLPGDPFRSVLIAETIAHTYGTAKPDRPLAHKREFCTYLTDIQGVKVLVTSTGIGGPSTSIAVDELAQLGVHTFIRVGTTGVIQDSIDIGDVVITTGSVRLDGASLQYAPIEYPAVAHHEVLLALIKAAKALTPALQCRYHVGITASTDTFYQGQERPESFLRYVPRRIQGMTEEWRRLHVLNYEMESATLLTVCSAFGLRAGCVTGVVNNRATDADGVRITSEHLRLGQDHAVRVGIKAMERLVQADRSV